MSSRANIPLTTIFSLAVQRTLGSLPLLLLLSVAVGGVGHVLMYWAGLAAAPHGGSDPNSRFLYSELAKLGVGMVWGVLFFPLIDAASIYAWRQEAKGEKPSAYKAINFALGRYRRMLGPHAIAYVTISLGMVIIIPGILFGLQYAFVDAITATDDRSKDPLSRSKKLTAGRRGKIFQSWVPYAVWYVPAYLWLVYVAEGKGALAVLGFGALDVLLLVVMEMVMFGLYEERIEDARRAQANRQAGGGRNARPGEGADEPESADAPESDEPNVDAPALSAIPDALTDQDAQQRAMEEAPTEKSKLSPEELSALLGRGGDSSSDG